MTKAPSAGSLPSTSTIPPLSQTSRHRGKHPTGAALDFVARGGDARLPTLLGRRKQMSMPPVSAVSSRDVSPSVSTTASVLRDAIRTPTVVNEEDKDLVTSNGLAILEAVKHVSENDK